jgi:hypothetical protein
LGQYSRVKGCQYVFAPFLAASFYSSLQGPARSGLMNTGKSPPASTSSGSCPRNGNQRNTATALSHCSCVPFRNPILQPLATLPRLLPVLAQGLSQA